MKAGAAGDDGLWLYFVGPHPRREHGQADDEDERSDQASEWLPPASFKHNPIRLAVDGQEGEQLADDVCPMKLR